MKNKDFVADIVGEIVEEIGRTGKKCDDRGKLAADTALGLIMVLSALNETLEEVRDEILRLRQYQETHRPMTRAERFDRGVDIGEQADD